MQLPSNLYRLLEQAASSHPTSGISFYNSGDLNSIGSRVTYRSLFEISKANARLLGREERHTSDLKPVLLHFGNHQDNIEWFWATTIAGLVPVISTPLTNDEEQRKRHLTHLKTLLKDPLVLTTKVLAGELSSVEGLNVKTVEDLRAEAANGSVSAVKSLSALKEELQVPKSALSKKLDGNAQALNEVLDNAIIALDEFSDDSSPGSPIQYAGSERKTNEIAAMMLTSGSTGNAKAVCLRHGQLISALKGKSTYHGTKTDDTFLSWIGLDHVANLTEIHLHAMSIGAEQIQVPAADLLVRPLAFLELVDKHRVAYTFGPNFFLASLRTALEKPQPFDHLEHPVDFTCLRALISGGEVNVVETCDAVTTLLRPFGAPGNVVRPGFGMTETCAGSIYSLNCPTYDLANSHEFTSLGSCIPGLAMRITNNGYPASPNEVGDLELYGPILFNEYYNNAEATKESFTSDGWFITGDRGRLDTLGQLNLVGRAKESMIINGVKYFPHSIETAVVEAKIEGMAPAYTVVFPHRPRGSQTEVMCVVYLPTYHFTNIEARVSVADAISKITTLQCGVRPYSIIPLEQEFLPKSSLGKLSRAKVRTAFEAGVYDAYRRLNDILIADYRAKSRQAPTNETETIILQTFAKMFEISELDIGVNSSLFEMGATSIELIRFKQEVGEALKLTEDIPVITVLTNPTIRGLAKALEALNSDDVIEYSPAICLQSEGDKTPLWLVHPGVGEVLVFLNLAKLITDRPVYALRARGFNKGEDFFNDIPEVVASYHKAIKEVQPEGPYAISGYSYGAMLAFETTKVLEANGDTVGFLGALNLPPHIKFRMRQLDWIEVILNLSYFLDFMTEEYAHAISPGMHLLTHDEVLDRIMAEAPPQRIAEMSLDKHKLTVWADLAYRMQAIAQDYDPSGRVQRMDVFYAVPLSAVAKSKKEWLTNHLSKWSEFVREEPRFVEVDGAHYTMLDPTNVLSFSKKIKGVLKDRGL